MRERQGDWRRRLVGWAIVLALLVVSGAAADRGHAASSRADWVDFQATDDFVFDPSLPLDPLLAAIDCINGESMNNPVQPCSPGSRIRIRGVLSQSAIASSEPRFTGIETVTVNANLDPQYSGQAWGGWSLAVGEGLGLWEGTWRGSRTHTPGGGPTGGDAWTTRIELIGFGSGSVAGLHVTASETIVTFAPLPLPYEALGFCVPGACPPEGAITGRILVVP
jgi:hypothetical protein